MKRNERWEPDPPRALREPDAYSVDVCVRDTLGFIAVILLLVAIALLLDAVTA